MEYGNRKLLHSNPAPEPTALTMRSIHEILAETGDEGLLQPARPKAAQTTQSSPRAAGIQAPPSASFVAHRTAVAQKAEPVRDTAKVADAAARENSILTTNTATKTTKPQSFGRRLASKVFGRK